MLTIKGENRTAICTEKPGQRKLLPNPSPQPLLEERYPPLKREGKVMWKEKGREGSEH